MWNIDVNCEKCGKLMSKYYLRKHMREVHFGEKREEGECDICGKLLLKQDLSRHMRQVHFGKDRGECEICGKAVPCQTHEGS